MKVILVSDNPLLTLVFRYLSEKNSEYIEELRETKTIEEAEKLLKSFAPAVIFAEERIRESLYNMNIQEKYPEVFLVLLNEQEGKKEILNGQMEVAFYNSLTEDGWGLILAKADDASRIYREENTGQEKLIALDMNYIEIIKKYSLLLLKDNPYADVHKIVSCLEYAGVYCREDNIYPIIFSVDSKTKDCFLEKQADCCDLIKILTKEIEKIFENSPLKCYLIDSQKEIFGLIFCRPEISERVCRIFLQQKLGKFLKSMDEIWKFTISCGIGSRICQYQDLKDAYVDAKRVLNYRLFYGSASLIFSEDAKISANFDYQSLDILEFDRKVKEALVHPVEADIAEISRNMFLGHLKKSFDVQFTENTCRMIQMMLWKLLREWGQSFQMLRSLTRPYYENVEEICTLEERCDWFIALCSTFTNVLDKMKMRQHTDENTRKAILYIFKNFHEDIELRDIAEYIGVTPTYFSSYFKKQTQKTFKDFLNHIRMEKAREYLLTTDYRIYEIAQMVGMNDPKHFSQVFRKHFNLSPTDIRKNHNEDY